MADVKSNIGKYTIWYNTRNKVFLEKVAQLWSRLTDAERKKLDQVKTKSAGCRYQALYQNGDLYLTGIIPTGKSIGKVYVAPNRG